MAELLWFRRNAKPQEEAATWIARLDRGLSDADRALLRKWIDADSINGKALLQMAELWDQLDLLSELAALFPLAERHASKTSRARTHWALAVCLAAAVAIVPVSLKYSSVNSHDTQSSAVQNTEFAFQTALGEHTTKDLPDGSLVTLNTNTSIRIAYTEGTRDVFLERGEAYFDVAHNVARPFRVHVGDKIVQAVGTAFDVELRNNGEIELTVTNGKVSVAHLGTVPETSGAQASPAAGGGALTDVTLVSSGESAVVHSSDGDSKPEITRLASADIGARLAWQRGMLVFQGERLEDVIAEVSRYTATRMEIDDGELGSVRVGGYFRAGDVNGLLTALRTGFEIEADQAGSDRIILHRRK